MMKPTPLSNTNDIDKVTLEIIWQYISNAIKSPSSFVIPILGKYSEEII